MTATATMDTTRVSVILETRRLQAAYRKRGWTIWHGDATGQFWAAHTGRMVLLSGDCTRQLADEIEKIQSGRPPTGIPRPRQASSWRLPPRPRPRGSR